MAKNGKPFLPNLEALIAMGIDPKTGLPLKFGGTKKTLKTDIKKALRVIDEQDAINRFVWYNLPCDITSQDLERMLYYRGQLCFFYCEDLDKFFFMPYALNGNIDAYGRYKTIVPVPFTNGTEEKDMKKNNPVSEYFSKMKLEVVYGLKMPEDINWDTLTKSAVIVRDYSRQLNEQIIPRMNINDSILDVMADCVPFMRTNLLLSTGVKGLRVNDADQAASAVDASRSMERGALEGDPFVPIIGPQEFQELTDGQVAKSEEYMLAMQSLDNFRLSTYGIDNGGLFEKKAHELQSEADINGGPVGLVLQDSLSIRQNFCNIVNNLWGLGIWCEPAENIIGADTNGDGVTYDRNEQGENSGVETQPSEGGNENDQ